MAGRNNRHERQLSAARNLLEHLAPRVKGGVSVQLWDGTKVPLGNDVDPNLFISINGPGVIGSFLRWPTPDRLLRHYVRGNIDFHGADILTFMTALSSGENRKSRPKLKKSLVARSLLPFLFEPASSSNVKHDFQGDSTGRNRVQAENLDFIKFHYDVSNEFYELFLDSEMLYTCAYFTDENNSLEQAQFDKMDHTCRKLQLSPGERFLDIGCGWGGLLCHAAKYYGVKAHGITLSKEQLAFTEAKARRMGLQDLVTVELIDYAYLEGEYDKIASICMYEHVGIDNLPGYMEKVNSLLTKHGLFLLQGITRPGKASMKQFRRMNVERRMLAKYIFPGGELSHLGHITESMESKGFEVADVEGWRNHYIRTCRMWAERLYARRDEAIACVGSEMYRMWLLYLAGCSMAFLNGGARLYQVLAEKHVKREEAHFPLTRGHLYADKSKAKSAAKVA